MTEKEMEEGWYWVMISDGWEVAHFEYDVWTRNWSDHMYSASDFQEIGPRLTPPRSD